MARDPVCGMEVREEKAAARSERGGKTYYFCSPGCKAEFEKSPDKYATPRQGREGHGHSH